MVKPAHDYITLIDLLSQPNTTISVENYQRFFVPNYADNLMQGLEFVGSYSRPLQFCIYINKIHILRVKMQLNSIFFKLATIFRLQLIHLSKTSLHAGSNIVNNTR